MTPTLDKTPPAALRPTPEPAPDQTRTLGERMREEHRHIFRVVGGLEAWLSAGGPGPADWVRHVTRRLSELRQVLEPHFEAEREGALYAQAPSRMPHLGARLDRLVAEHLTMLQELDGIMAVARRASEPDEALVRQLTARLLSLFDQMRSHEGEEAEILAAAFWDDLEAAD